MQHNVRYRPFPSIKLMTVSLLLWVLHLSASDMPGYPVYRLNDRPVIDGVLADVAWQGLPQATGFRIFSWVPRPHDDLFAWQKPTSFRVGWDGEALYIAIRCREPFTHRLSPRPNDGDKVYADDSIELFISTDAAEYYQFVVNSAGARWNGKSGAKRPGLWDWQAAAETAGDEWTAEIRIPFSVLGTSPREGDAWKFNLARNVLIGPDSERYSSWAPVKTSFSDIPNFADMLFMAAPAADRAAAVEQALNEPFHEYVQQRSKTAETRVRNGWFDESLRGWGATSAERVAIDETTATIGTRSIRLDGVLEPAEPPVFVRASQVLRLKPGTRYVLRADIKRSKFAGTISVDVIERDADDLPWKHHRCGDQAQEGDVPGGWGRYELRFATSDNMRESQLQLYNIGSDAVAWYDNIQLVEDDGSGGTDRSPRATRTLRVDVSVRDASAKLLVNGESVAGTPGEPIAIVVREGLNALAVEAGAQGPNPGVRLRVLDCPETDGRWRVSAESDPVAAWTTVAYDDRDWPAAVPDDDGFIWATGHTAPRTLMRQVVLWNQRHDGPDRCINPLLRQWGISEGSAETLFKAVYSPFPFPLDDYEFLFDVPEDFRLLDIMHEDRGRNTLPSGLVEEQTHHDGALYRRYRVSFPPDRMYAAEESTASRYLLLPVLLERWTGEGTSATWYYRRQAKGNFTELQQRIPVQLLPPIDGRMLEKIMVGGFAGTLQPWRGHLVSREHLEQHLAQSFLAGFNTWFEIFRGNLAELPYLKTAHDRVLREKNARIVLWSNHPFYGLQGERGETRPFLDKWLRNTPQARARYFQDGDTWETRRQYCPTYALAEGRDEFYHAVLENYRVKLEVGLPGTSIVWSDFEEAPWVNRRSARIEDQGASWCFCDRCKHAFRTWAELPQDADLSDGNLFGTYREKWHTFRSGLDGQVAGVARQAANALGRNYMVYSWTWHTDFWAAMKGNIDVAFPGSPGNPVADGARQSALDRNALFFRDTVGIERSRVMGQRFTFFSTWATTPKDDQREFWRNWTVLSPTGYLEPKTWKSQILRVVAAYGGGIDIQHSMQWSGGILYWVGEATRILAEYEDIFHAGERDDGIAASDRLAYPNLLVLKKGSERVVLLFNEYEHPLDIVLKNKDLRPGQSAGIYGTDIRTDHPSEMTVSIPAGDVAVVHIR